MNAELKVEILQRSIRGLEQRLSLLTAKVDGLETYVGRVLSAFEDRMSRELKDEMAGIHERMGAMGQQLERILEKLP